MTRYWTHSLPFHFAIALAAALLSGCAEQSISTTESSANRSKSALSATVTASISRGINYLVTSQQPDGSWGTGLETRGFEVYAIVPGTHDALRVGTTALCVMALREAGEKTAHDKGVQYLIHHGRAYRDSADMIYNIWAHTYGIQALSAELRAGNADPQLKSAILWHIDRLVRYEVYMGGWNYYDFAAQTQRPSMEPTSFGTASALLALYEAKQAGIELPKGLAERAVRRLHEMRLPTGTYMYDLGGLYHPRAPHNMLRGSIGRTTACNFALWQWNHPDIGPADARQSLDLFAREHAFIEMGRKRPIPHESWYNTAGYYYYYGHYHAALLAEKLGPPFATSHLDAIIYGILPYQEDDGSWWDFAMWDYHKPYGTAYAVMALMRCGRMLPA